MVERMGVLYLKEEEGEDVIVIEQVLVREVKQEVKIDVQIQNGIVQENGDVDMVDVVLEMIVFERFKMIIINKK